jgi:hypothetical protein
MMMMMMMMVVVVVVMMINGARHSDSMTIAVFRDAMLCSLVDRYHCLR